MQPPAISSICVPRDGESDCGDAVVVRVGEASTLLCVIDALGHGPNASCVATLAMKTIEGCDPARGVEALIRDVHAALQGGRGTCLLACIVSPGSIEGASVGNVELRSSGVDVSFVQTPGVVGLRIPRLRVFRAPIPARFRLIAYSDGISSRFQVADYADFSPEQTCRAIFDRGRRAHDDATILVADFGS